MIDVRPFKAEDMMSLLKTGIMECGITSAGNELLLELAQSREESGMCYSGFREDKLIGCAGVELKWQGVAELWMLIGEAGKETPVQVVRTLQKRLDMIMKEKGLWRVQTTGRCDFPQALRLIEMLGMTRDCPLKCYGPDKSDYFLYSMVI